MVIKGTVADEIFLDSKTIAMRSRFAVQQQKCFIKFWAINKTEVQFYQRRSRGLRLAMA